MSAILEGEIRDRWRRAERRACGASQGLSWAGVRGAGQL